MAVVAIKDLVTKLFKRNLSQETMPKLIKDCAALSIKKTPRKRFWNLFTSALTTVGLPVTILMTRCALLGLAA